MPSKNIHYYLILHFRGDQTMDGVDNVSRTEDVDIKGNISFAEMMLSDAVLVGLTKNNFKNPSPIQLKAIPLGRCGMDLLIKSKSGTGKTLVFCTIALERYNALLQAPQSLIVVPTREVALQIESYLNMIGASCKGFRAVSVIGGRDICEDRRRLSKCKAIVATLGRLLHLIKNCVISIKQIKLVVLDEADKLISSDFRTGIDELFKMFSQKPQVIASSATYANGLDKLLLTYMQNPAAVSATHEMPTLIGIKQFVHVVLATDETHSEATTPIIKMMKCKVNAIEYILKRVSFKQCILFSNSQMRAESFFTYLTSNGWKVDLIIGSHEQPLRTSTFQKFCKFESRILIASDVLARGIDVGNVNLVINLDVPTDSSTYLHRIGRCGRFGTYGIAITLINDDMDMKQFEKMLGTLGTDGIKVSLLPLISELDNSRLWDFSNKQSDASIFDESDAASNDGEGSGDYREISSNVIESNQNNVDTHNQNLELLQISKSMLENKSQCNVQVDVDLFTDYSNQDDDVTSNTEIDKMDAEITAYDVMSNSVENSNEKHQHIDEVIKIRESDNFKHRAFLQAVKNLQICHEYHGESPIPIDSKPETEDSTEDSTEGKPDTSIYVAAKRNKNAVKERDGVRKSYSGAQNHWQHIYWQQFNQINQYFCWIKSGLPPK